MARAKPTETATPQKPLVGAKPAGIHIASAASSTDSSRSNSPKDGGSPDSEHSSRSGSPEGVTVGVGKLTLVGAAAAVKSDEKSKKVDSKAAESSDDEEELSLHDESLKITSYDAVLACINKFAAEIDSEGKSAKKEAYLKAFVNEPNKNKTTPLHIIAVNCATILRNPDITKVTLLLLGKGANVNAQDVSLGTPMHSAVCGYADFMLDATHIYGQPQHKDTLKSLAEGNFYALMGYLGLLINAGADCTLKDKTQKTALDDLAAVIPVSLKSTVKIDRDSILRYFTEGFTKAAAAKLTQTAAVGM